MVPVDSPRWHVNPRARSWRCPPPDGAAGAFHRSLPGYRPTPLVDLPPLAAELGVARVLVKDETSRLGLPAFKALGASWAVHRALRQVGARTGDDAPPEGTVTVVTATDGNHGRAVARFARLAGQLSRIVVPTGVSAPAVAAIRAEGADVIRVDGSYDDAVALAAESCRDGGAVLVQDTAWPGYQEVPGWIVAGYDTLFAEIDGQLADLGCGGAALVAVPVGVGSLAQAAVAHYRSGPAGPALLSVEPDAAPCLVASLVAGAPVTVATGRTAMAGLNCGTVSAAAWPYLAAGIDAAVTVTDAQAARACADLARAGVPAGPCGGATLAGIRAALSGPDGAARRDALGLTAASVLVLLCTEGAPDDPIAVLRELIAIASVNPDLVAGGAGESAVADFCGSWLAERGFDVHRLERRPGRPTVVGVARGLGGGRSLILDGHTDTVGLAGYGGDPLVATVRDGAIHGRGAFDMKGGVAAMMVAAARAVAAGPLRGDVIVACVADEEHGSAGTAELLESYTADGAIVTEPSCLQLTLSHKGFAWFDVDVLGRAAHGSRPDLGIDAIAKAGHLLVAVERWGRRLADGPADPRLGHPTVHASTISGGREASTYPERCTVTLEYRSIPGETGESIAADLTRILDGIAAEVPDFAYRMRPGLCRAPFRADPDAEVVRVVRRHAERHLGGPPVERAEPFWTDCALLDAAGIPCLLIGVDGDGAHAAAEWADVGSVHTLTGILADTVTDFCR